MDIQTALNLYFAGFMINGVLLVFFFIVAGPWMKAYGLARLATILGGSGKVMIEYTPTKEYRPVHANIEKSLPNAIKLPGKDRGIAEIRRTAWGQSSGIQTTLCPTEMGITVSPTEVGGEKWYGFDLSDFTQGVLTKDADGRPVIKEMSLDEKISAVGSGQKSKYWIKAPLVTASPDEFTKFQTVSGDPLMREHYAEHKANEIRAELHNPMASMLAQHGHILILGIVAGGLAYTWMSQQNSASSAWAAADACKQTMVNLYQAGVCKGTMPALNAAAPVINATLVPTGGAVI